MFVLVECVEDDVCNLFSVVEFRGCLILWRVFEELICMLVVKGLIEFGLLIFC